jgi:hypothetical protein
MANKAKYSILQYASHVQHICASNFYFAHNFYPNLTPHEAGDSDRLVLFIFKSIGTSIRGRHTAQEFDLQEVKNVWFAGEKL